MGGTQTTVAVIGAGISGLSCARALTDQGTRVVVFEQDRQVGGRMASQCLDGRPAFDHGAQYFTVRDERFRRRVNDWLREGVAALWKGRIGTLSEGRLEWKQTNPERFVGVPGMHSVCELLAKGIEVRFETRVAAPQIGPSAWELFDDQRQPLGVFDYVVASAPAPQSASLLEAAPALQGVAAAAEMKSCWAAMLEFGTPLELACDGAFVEESPLSWIARSSSKPGRRGADTWTLHASPEWSDPHRTESAESVLPKLLDAFWRATNLPPITPRVCHAFLWPYAVPTKPLDGRFLFDATRRIGACGDWCGGSRVEGAFASGLAMAACLLADRAG